MTRVLLIGHLRGIATLTGLRLFASEILPQFRASVEFRVVGGDKFTSEIRPQFESVEFRIVGGDELTDDLKHLANHPLVTMVGHVSPADEEFRTADIVLVPTPITLGVRVRIITAMMRGCCIVAHSANKQGIPELMHNENCALGRDGDTLAMLLRGLIQYPTDRRQLGYSARQTYEQYFSMETAGKALVERVI